MSVLDAALAYAARGWLVFPLHGLRPDGRCACGHRACGSPGKHPRVAWMDLATTNADQVRRWWPPGCTDGIGLATGKASGVWVLDIDPRHDGDVSLAEIVRRNSELPETLTSLTGGGGQHYFFAYPTGDEVIRNVAGLAEGIDVRGDGGFVVLPPSPHVSGRAYRWEITTEDTPPVEAPAWLLRAVVRSRRPASAAPLPGKVAVVTSDYGRAALEREADAVRTARAGTRNDTLWRAACKLGALVAGGEILEADARAALYRAGCEAGDKGTERKVEDTLDRGLQLGAMEPRSAPPRGPPRLPPELRGTAPADDERDDRPTIYFEPNKLYALARLTEEYTAGHGWPIFSRAGGLVSLTRTVGLPPRLTQVGTHRLRGMADRAIRWVQEKRSRDGEPYDKPITAPIEVIQVLGELGEWRHFPCVDSVTESPTLRPDGSVVEEPGYDPTTRLLYVPAGEYPRVPDRPTHADATAAALRLMDLFDEFPFVELCDASAVLASILTMCLRSSMTTAPIFHVDSDTPGTGKTLIPDVVVRIVTGRPMIPQSQIDDENEFNKMLTAEVIEGSPYVIIDNARGTFGSPTLDKVLTSGFHAGRLLNRSEMVRLPCRATFWVTGNNLVLAGDLPRRTIQIRIVANLENPAQGREFKIKNLRAHALEHRHALVVDALTIARAYAVAGFPDHGPGGPMGGAPLGSFEEWDRLVRRPLLWLGMADPLDTQKRLQAADNPDLELVLMAMDAWTQLFGPKVLTLADVLRAITGELSETEQRLRDALDGLCGGKAKNARSLGMVLKRYVGRIVSGKRFVRTRKESGTLYTVETIAKAVVP